MTTTSDQDLSTNVYIPINVANRIAGSTRYQSFSIVTSVGVNSTDFATTVQTYMNNFYSKNQDYTISASSMESLVNSMSSLINTLKLAISAIAAIALLVGGIGVMNIMLVSITERTKEIGTRKALGAKNSGIRIQFVTESALICFIGGIIGVLFGTGLGLIVSTVMGYSGSASISNIIVAVGFSIAIGIFFGYYPANKAAKLDPIY
jgi:putative ABC transport system permease protein